METDAAEPQEITLAVPGRIREITPTGAGIKVSKVSPAEGKLAVAAGRKVFLRITMNRE